MADYREHYSEIRASGANLVAVSVDPLHKSEAVRQQLSLPFPILCDTARRVVQDWHVYNAREKGGIAKPSVFVIGPDRTVRYAAVDTVAKRVPASEIIRVLNNSTHNAQRKLYIPKLADWVRAIRNSF